MTIDIQELQKDGIINKMSAIYYKHAYDANMAQQYEELYALFTSYAEKREKKLLNKISKEIKKTSKSTMDMVSKNP